MLCKDLIGLNCMTAAVDLSACCPGDTCRCRSSPKHAVLWVAGSCVVLFAHLGFASPADHLLRGSSAPVLQVGEVS